MAKQDFFSKMRTLDELPTKHPSPGSALVAIRGLLSDCDVRREFFRRLDDPTWIEPLRDAGYFNRPPVSKLMNGTSIQFPPWPESMYLARMAAGAPETVAAVFAGITTDNASIIGDMLDGAVVMPASVAASLVPALCRAVASGALWMGFKDASDLCVRLAKGGESDAALTLAEALFTPEFAEGEETPRGKDDYWYKEGLGKVVPVLAESKGAEFIPKLCDWLDAAVRARRQGDSGSGGDLSYFWRPAIEDHEQNRDYQFAGVMVGFVRNGLEHAIRARQLSLTSAIELLDRYDFLVFRRIRVYLIDAFADESPELAKQTILDRTLFGDYKYKHEYARLVRRRFDLLSQEQQLKWFGWVDAGDHVDHALGEDLTEEARRKTAQGQRFEKLHWVREHLDAQRREFYEKMVSERGEPKLADLNFRIESAFRGSEAPMTVEALTAMAFEEAVAKVSAWQPATSRFDGPSVEGLASVFKQYVATSPVEFSAHARTLLDRPPLYVRMFIAQMGEAANKGESINLEAVLDLCKWILDRPVEEQTTSEEVDEADEHTPWQGCRDEVSGFLKRVCAADKNDTPTYPLAALREPMWNLIERLCRDRIDLNIVHDVSKDDPRARDYLDLAINSPRGKAVEAALEYARWVAMHFTGPEGRQSNVPGGFNTMPEVREALEWQMDAENRSVETLAIIGARIGVVLWIDKKWLAQNATRLFDLRGIERTPPAGQGWAAWNTFLGWVEPHIEYYRAFESEFAYAVEQAALVDVTGRTHEKPMLHLGEHLMTLYGRGQLGLDDGDGLLRQFLKDAKPEVRCHAIDFVGRSLRGDESVPEEVIERFMTLWELYWNGPGKEDAAHLSGTGLFLAWFSCGHFPQQWSLDRLQDFVSVASAPRLGSDLAEKLAEAAHADIVSSVKILDLVIRRDREGWGIRGWKDSAKSILEQAMRSPGEARQVAIALVDHLGRRGFIEFGKLLKL